MDMPVMDVRPVTLDGEFVRLAPLGPHQTKSLLPKQNFRSSR